MASRGSSGGSEGSGSKKKKKLSKQEKLEKLRLMQSLHEPPAAPVVVTTAPPASTALTTTIATSGTSTPITSTTAAITAPVTAAPTQEALKKPILAAPKFTLTPTATVGTASRVSSGPLSQGPLPQGPPRASSGPLLQEPPPDETRKVSKACDENAKEVRKLRGDHHRRANEQLTWQKSLQQSLQSSQRSSSSLNYHSGQHGKRSNQTGDTRPDRCRDRGRRSREHRDDHDRRSRSRSSSGSGSRHMSGLIGTPQVPINNLNNNLTRDQQDELGSPPVAELFRIEEHGPAAGERACDTPSKKQRTPKTHKTIAVAAALGACVVDVVPAALAEEPATESRTCGRCKQSYTGSIDSHYETMHLDVDMKQCAICPRTFRIPVIRHYKHHHADLSINFIDKFVKAKVKKFAFRPNSMSGDEHNACANRIKEVRKTMSDEEKKIFQVAKSVDKKWINKMPPQFKPDVKKS